MTVREMVADVGREIRGATDLSGRRAAELEMKLSALLGNVLEEIRKADATCAEAYADLLREHGKASHAQIHLETTEAFQHKREARDTHAWMLEMVRTLRQYQRSENEAMRLAR